MVINRQIRVTTDEPCLCLILILTDELSVIVEYGIRQMLACRRVSNTKI